LSLAQLRIEQGRKADARQILTTAFGLLEGSDVADMRKVTTLLDTLSS